jgi:hypothetical protein
MKKISVYRSKSNIPKETIELFAQSQNVSFPKSYINLLSEHNWLRPQEDTFDFINIWNKADARDINFCGYEVESYVGSGTIADEQDFDIYGHENVIAIGFSANGDYIAFDYRQNLNTDNPPVVLMYHDEYIEDEHGQYKMAISKVADSFDEFIDMLYEDVD